jgi:hypothetical protein
MGVVSMGVKENIVKAFFSIFFSSAKKHRKEISAIQERHKLDKGRVIMVTISDVRLRPRYCQGLPDGGFRIFTSSDPVDFTQEVILDFKTLMNIVRGNIDIEYAVLKGLIKIKSNGSDSFMQMRFTGDAMLMLNVLKLVLDDVKAPFAGASGGENHG